MEYASRWLRWEDGPPGGNGTGATLAVYTRTHFGEWAAHGVPEHRKGRVEFASGLRLDPADPSGSTVLVAYGVGDCAARVARVALALLEQLPVDVWLERA